MDYIRFTSKDIKQDCLILFPVTVETIVMLYEFLTVSSPLLCIIRLEDCMMCFMNHS